MRSCKVQLTIVVFHQLPIDSTYPAAFSSSFFALGAGHITVLVLSGNLLQSKMVVTIHKTQKLFAQAKDGFVHMQPQIRLDLLVLLNTTKYMLLKMASGLIGQLVL